MMWILLCVVSCQRESSDETTNVQVHATGFSFVSQQEIQKIEIHKNTDVLVQQDFVAPLFSSTMQFIWPEDGEYELHFWNATNDFVYVYPISITEIPIVDVKIQAPIGEKPTNLHDEFALSSLENSQTTISLMCTALYDSTYEFRIGDHYDKEISLLQGESHLILYDIKEDTTLHVHSERGFVDYDIKVQNTSLSDIQQKLYLRQDLFPVNSFGEQDIWRDQDRITLQDPWIEKIKSFIGFQFRISDEAVPWGFARYDFQNDDTTRHTLAVQHRIVDETGNLVSAFRPTNRWGKNENGWVRTLISIPTQTSGHIQLPIFLKEQDLKLETARNIQLFREIEVFPLGSQQKIYTKTIPLYISQTSSFALWGTIISLICSCFGGIFLQYVFLSQFSNQKLIGRKKNDPSRFSLRDCISIACFSSILFVSGTIAHMLGLLIAIMLGPFATMLTTGIDYLFRYPLIVTVLFISPRIGTYALFSTIAWLLSGFSTGSFGLMDILFLTSRVFFMEFLLYLLGITRSQNSDWKQQSVLQQKIRFGIALSISGLLYGATGMALHVSLYRLYYADWYIAMMLLGPGFLYIWIATWISVPFARSIVKVLR